MKNTEKRLYPGDVAAFAEAIGLDPDTLFRRVHFWVDVTNGSRVFTTYRLLLRYICRECPTHTVRKALSLAA